MHNRPGDEPLIYLTVMTSGEVHLAASPTEMNTDERWDLMVAAVDAVNDVVSQRASA